MIAPATPTVIAALRRIEANSDVTDMDPHVLKELRLARLIYTGSDQQGGKVFGHLKEKGREALERAPR